MIVVRRLENYFVTFPDDKKSKLLNQINMNMITLIHNGSSGGKTEEYI